MVLLQSTIKKLIFSILTNQCRCFFYRSNFDRDRNIYLTNEDSYLQVVQKNDDDGEEMFLSEELFDDEPRREREKKEK